MPEENNERSEGGIKTPFGELTFKGKRIAEFIALISLTLLFLLAYILYEHKGDTKTSESSLAAAIKEQAAAQRLMSCLISLPQDQRKREFASESSFCRQLSRMQ